MSDLQIRLAREDEFEAIAKLAVDAFAEFAAKMSPDAWSQFAQRIADVGAREADDQVVVAVRDDELVGAVMLYTSGEDRHPDAYTIRGLAVPPEARGTGVGSALVEWCMQRAVDDGRARLVATTTPEMEDARELYHKHGFVRDPDLDEKPAPGVTAAGYAVKLSDRTVASAL